jgi:hypothetical protein
VFSCSPSRAGQQCCYNGDSLVVGPPGGGTLDVVAPGGFLSTPKHFLTDVVPWFMCCKYSDNCGKYYQRRPSDDGKRYVPPQIGK